MDFFLREWRDYAGLTQDQLVSTSRVAKSTINKLENSQTRIPRMSTLRRLAEAVGVEHYMLRKRPPLGGSTSRPPTPVHRDEVLPVESSRVANPAPSVSESDRGSDLGAALLAELSNSERSGDDAEAIVFVALFSSFYARMLECEVRPEAYQGYVQATRRVLEHAEVLARAMFCETTANTITNDEMGVQPHPQQRALAANAFARWRLVQRPLIERWAGGLPWWDDEYLARLIDDFEVQDALLAQRSELNTVLRPDMRSDHQTHAQPEEGA
jgi:transcriptional regulator with XRE-family HTH domain